MREDADLSALPQAIPLRTVAPFWRVLAVLALLCSAALGLACLLLVFAWLPEAHGPIPSPPIAWQQVPAVAVAADEALPPDLPLVPGDLLRMSPDSGGPAIDPRTVPYPVRADLAPPKHAAAGQATRSTAARRFLRLGEDMAKMRKDQDLNHLLVSPDGKYVAAIHGGRLFVGPVSQGLTREIGDMSAPVYGVGEPGGGEPPPDGGSTAPSPPTLGNQPADGEPAWYAGAPVVYWAGGDGRLRRCRLEDGPGGLAPEGLPLAGDAPAPIPGMPEKLVFVRSRPTPKVEAPGGRPSADPAEVVLRDLGPGGERVLIPAGRSAWRHPTVSPDGSRLALLSDQGNEDKTDPLWRVFVMELAGGEPKPVTPFGRFLGPLCWTPDGAGLVYARHARPSPPDHWEEGAAAGEFFDCDLFHLGLAGNVEARLSRGGGCYSPSADGAGHLYYLTHRGGKGPPALTLRRMPLATARAFAEKELDRPARTVAAWQKLADRVLAEAGLAADADGAKLTPEVVLAKVAHGFARAAEELGLPAPASLQDLDRLRAELLHLNVPAAKQSRLRLLLGAVVGDFLYRHHEALWNLTAGPLVLERAAPPEPAEANPFVEPFNPFAVPLGKDWSYQDHVVARAEGRRLVLTNAAAPDKELLQDLTNPDLARGVELLRAGKAEEGERVLRKLLERGPHRANRFLALHIGRLLYTCTFRKDL